MKTASKHNANRKGAVLVTAVAVMIMLSILLTATISFVAQNKKTTNDNYKSQQAYLTASSTLESFIAQIQTDTAPTSDPAGKAAQQKAIDDLKALANANSGAGTTTNVSYNGNTDNTDNMGTTTINVKWDGASTNAIVVTCETTYLGQTEQVAAHISTQANTKPADFNNTIELTGSGDVSYDNLNVIGDMAGINNTTGKTYTFANQTSVYGSYLMYGSLVPGTGGARMILKPSLVDSTKGSTITISENFNGVCNITSSMPKNTGYNYVNIGQKFKTTKNSVVGDSANKIDVYCCEAEITENTYTHHGDMYVSTGTGVYLGDAYFSADSVTIDGSLYVQGDLTVTKNLKVTGEVKVGGSITGKDKINCSTIDEGVTVNINKPVIPSNSDDYVYFPEDFLMSTDTKITSISNTYKSFYNGTNNDTFLTYADSTWASNIPINETMGGVPYHSEYAFKITNSCTMAINDFKDCGKMGNAKRILIEVTDASKDIVIRLENGLSLGSEYSPQIIVRNRSSSDPATGEKHKYNCYFVSDAGTSINLNGLGPDGKSQHSGAAICNYSIMNFRVYDYDTYVRMFTADELNNQTGIPSNVNTGFSLNYTDVDVAGAYRPGNSGIIFLFTEGTNFKVSNNAFIQGCVYSPQAVADIATSGMSLNVCDSTGTKMTVETCAVGIVVAKDFGNANKAYYVFQKPSSSTMLAGAKGNKSDKVAGFTLDRYDHY